MRHIYLKGFATSLIVAFIGCFIQLLIGGGVNITLWAFPLNLILFAFIAICAATLRYGFSNSRVYRLLRDGRFSAGALTGIVLFTLLMGTLVQRVQLFGETTTSESAFSDLFFAMVHSWLYVGLLLLLLFILCVVMMARRPMWKLRYVAFLINHLGLLLLIIAGLIGAPDKQEYKVILREGHAVSQVYHARGGKVTLPFELTLIDFDTEHFPNKLAVIEFDTQTGQILDQMQQDLLPHTYHYEIGGYPIEILSDEIYADSLAVTVEEGSWLLNIDYSQGFAPLARHKALTLSKGAVKRYMATISAVDTSTDEQNSEIVMVNHPWVHQGHYIYLESFDPMMGVVLRISVDRWLWLAYLGLWMLIGGAILMFITGPVGFVYQPIESEKMKSELKNKRL